MIENQIIFEKRLQTKRYSNGQLALFVENHDREPIAELSIMKESIDLAPHEFILKDYSENEKITKDLLFSNSIVPTDRFVLIGSQLCPVCQIRSEV